MCTCIGIKSLFTIWQDHSLISGRRIPCCQVPEVPPVEEAKVPRTERSEEEEKAAREVEEHGPRRYQICHDLIWFAYIICVLFLIVSCVSLNRYTYIFWSRYILSCILKVLCTKQTTYLYTLPIHCFQLICLPMFWLFVKICSILHAVIQIDIVRKRGFARRTKSQVWLGNVRWWYTQGSRLWSHFNEPIRTSCG